MAISKEGLKKIGKQTGDSRVWLYKQGEEPVCAMATDVKTMEEEGWKHTPAGMSPVKGKAKVANPMLTILDNSVSVIKAALPAFDKKTLNELMDAEIAGKTRTGVTDAIQESLDK